MAPDLSADLARISAHIPRLERAAASAPTAVERAAALVELALWRMASDLAGHGRTVPDAGHPTRNDETEACRGH